MSSLTESTRIQSINFICSQEKLLYFYTIILPADHVCHEKHQLLQYEWISSIYITPVLIGGKTVPYCNICGNVNVYFLFGWKFWTLVKLLGKECLRVPKCVYRNLNIICVHDLPPCLFIFSLYTPTTATQVNTLSLNSWKLRTTPSSSD